MQHFTDEETGGNDRERKGKKKGERGKDRRGNKRKGDERSQEERVRMKKLDRREDNSISKQRRREEGREYLRVKFQIQKEEQSSKT